MASLQVSAAFSAPPRRWSVWTLRAAALAVGLAASLSGSEAYAASGFYLDVAGGLAFSNGDDLIVYEDPAQDSVPIRDPDDCCPPVGGAGSLRLGYGIAGYVAPEFTLIGNIFDAGNDLGGMGFIGGGVRLFPFKFLNLVGLSMDDFPVELGIGNNFGWGVTGRDFLYQGFVHDLDLSLAFRVASFFDIGFRTDFMFTYYDNFVYTDQETSQGVCLSDSGTFPEPFDPATQIVVRDQASCSGNGPDANFIIPQIFLSFHWDPLSG